MDICIPERLLYTFIGVVTADKEKNTRPFGMKSRVSENIVTDDVYCMSSGNSSPAESSTPKRKMLRAVLPSISFSAFP